MKLSVIIPSRNDHVECWNTIQSIRQTASAPVEIVVVDDQSEVPVVVPDKSVVVIRNIERVGVAASRHIGATLASGDWALFLDSHMRMSSGWYETASRVIEKADVATAFCSVCVGLSAGRMNMNDPQGFYNGATIHFYEKDLANPQVMQVFEGVWLRPREGDLYEIPCLMGGNYFIKLDDFFHVGGLRLLRGWGSDEPFWSLKHWLSGGSIRLIKGIQIGHQFRDHTTYTTEAWMPLYNKLAAITTILPDAEAGRLIARLPQGPDLEIAKRQIRMDANHILAEQAWNRRIFTRTFDWYCKYFGIPFNA